jgi:hypothetical protein
MNFSHDPACRIAGFRGIIAGDMGKTPEKSALTLGGSAATVPAPSRPLGEHGMGLWRAVMLEYGIADIGGRELLCLACQALDRAESLSAAIAKDGQTIRTRTGVRAHPALRDELANRALCARLLEKLGITVEAVKPPGHPPGFSSWIGPAR